MIQTPETRLCQTYNIFLLFVANTLSYMLVLAGSVLFLYGWAQSRNKTRSGR